jgi:hypothetical protein
MNESENPFERDHERVLFTVSREVAQAAIAQVVPCDVCNPDAAEFPFECILDRVMLFSGVHTDYFMPEPPVCPRCKSVVTDFEEKKGRRSTPALMAKHKSKVESKGELDLSIGTQPYGAFDRLPKQTESGSSRRLSKGLSGLKA